MKRTLWLVGGLLIALMGIGWALQGAYIVPATFMRGPEWIAIGSGVALLGFFLIWRAFKVAPPAPDESLGH